jgi:hypothetical protein
VRPRDQELSQQLDAGLILYDRNRRPLRGIRTPARRSTFLEQLLESIHRVKFVEVIRDRELSDLRANPGNALFDPLKAAVLQQRQGDMEEAFWLVFLFVHFGRNPRAGWRYAREIYGGLGQGTRWDWVHVRNNPDGFREWLNDHQDDLKRKGVPRGFGNHRKYESLNAYSSNGTGAAVESYVAWVAPPRTHLELMHQACGEANGDPRRAFDILYRSMKVVARFGRTARFDYLTMIGKLKLAPIEPGSTYMQGATGPLDGARMLFGSRKNAQTLDAWLVDLDAQLNVGMQVLEDALCNWQKSPSKFRPFRG